MTDEEYLIKYQEKYGKLDDEDKEYVLKCKKETDSMTEEEFKKMFEDWCDFEISSNEDSSDCLEY